MPTKISIIINNPDDPAAFEGVFAAVRSAFRALPGLERLEAAKVWPKEDGTPTPAYRTLDLYFASYDAASAAVTVPEAGEAFGALIGSGVPFIGLFSDIED